MRKMKSLVLAVIGLLCSMSVSAHDFEVDGIYYNITSEVDKTVEVTYSGNSSSAVDYEYSGSVTIPETVTYNANTYSVTTIGDDAFSQCSGLTCITIQNSVTSIGVRAFSGCSGLTSAEIGNGVTSIGSAAFWNCSGLTFVKIPKSVTIIKDLAFWNCSGLTSVEIGNNVISIENNAFYYCSALVSVKIPNSVTSIGDGAFFECSSLTSVEIGNGVATIGDRAFYNCPNLNSITSLSQYPPTVTGPNNPFKDYNATLYVPYSAKEAYAVAEGWNEFTNIVEFHGLTVSNADYATLYLDYSVEIPDGVEVYTAREIDGDRLMMELVEDVLPANTGVVVKAPAGTYTFTYTATDVPAIPNNFFKGTVVNEYINVPSKSTAFVLSKVNGDVGMYPAKLTDGRFLNNANKAYLLLDNNKLGLSDEELDTSVGGAQLSLRFNFGSATGIDAVQTETEKVIYDLYGRKVKQITGSGIYIIGGKKVYVR